MTWKFKNKNLPLVYMLVKIAFNMLNLEKSKKYTKIILLLFLSSHSFFIWSGKLTSIYLLKATKTMYNGHLWLAIVSKNFCIWMLKPKH